MSVLKGCDGSADSRPLLRVDLPPASTEPAVRTIASAPMPVHPLEHGGGGRGVVNRGLRLVHVTAVRSATGAAFADVHLHLRAGRVVGLAAGDGPEGDLLVDVVLGRAVPMRGRVLVDGRTPVPVAPDLPDARVMHLVQLEADANHAIATTVSCGASVLVLDVADLDGPAADAFVRELRRLAGLLDVAVLLRTDDEAALQRCDEAWHIGRWLRRHVVEQLPGHHASRTTPAAA